jgi:hypothetical protein
VLLDNVSHINAEREPRRFPGVGSTLLFRLSFSSHDSQGLSAIVQEHQLIAPQGELRIRPSLVIAELHLEDVWRENLDNSAYLAALELTWGEILK